MTTMMRYKKIMAIDPDVDRSGVAVIDVSSRTMTTSTMTMPELIESLRTESLKPLPKGELLVVVEASWLASANWHLTSRDNVRTAAAKGERTGRNHQVGMTLVELCRYYNLSCEERRPLLKVWHGKDGKITFTELSRLCKGSGITYEARKNNQEERDAALLAIDHSGIPMIM